MSIDTALAAPAPTKSLWSDLGGMMKCSEHLGMYATAELEARPNAQRITTPITVWDRLGPLDFKVALEEYDWVPACESCGFTPAAAEAAPQLRLLGYTNEVHIEGQLVSDGRFGTVRAHNASVRDARRTLVALGKLMGSGDWEAQPGTVSDGRTETDFTLRSSKGLTARIVVKPVMG